MKKTFSLDQASNREEPTAEGTTRASERFLTLQVGFYTKAIEAKQPAWCPCLTPSKGLNLILPQTYCLL